MAITKMRLQKRQQANMREVMREKVTLNEPQARVSAFKV